jgi:potassium-dependent mechanosensitive channel
MKLNCHIKWIVIFFLLILSQILYAAPASSTFNIAEANKTLDKLSIQLSIQNLNAKNLENAVDTLTSLQNEAKECVASAKTDLDEVNRLWEEAKTGIGKPEIKEAEKLTSVQTYLKEKKETLTRRQSECKLFVLRSGEAITAFGKTANELRTQALLKVKPNFWEKIAGTTHLTREFHANFNSVKFFQRSGLADFNMINSLILLALLVFGFLFGLKLQSILKKYIENKPAETFADKLHLSSAYIGSKYLSLIFIAVIFAVFVIILGYVTQQLTYLIIISCGILIYTLFSILISFFLRPVKAEKSIAGLTEAFARPLVFRLKILADICLFSFIIYILFREQAFSAAAIDLARTIFITLISVGLISILWLINRIPKLLKEHKILRFIISAILTCGLIAIIIAEWFGYQDLVTYVLKGITLSLGLGLIAWILHNVLTAAILSLTNDHLPLQEKLRHHLGLKRHEGIPELFWIRVIIYILIWGGFIIALLKIWGLSETNFRSLIDGIVDGFKVAGLDIIPSRIMSAFIVFILASIFIRWLRAFLAKRKTSEEKRGSQEAIAAIVSYVSMAMVLLIALIIAGVNFAGLAIIAGALSVGIGFGLQGIVNNFVSGIILLLERPIKPGDRIIVGDKEGYVKKISIRATQIKTLDYSDVIVPNSEVISTQVTNLMFHDFYGRLRLKVGVAYGSDTELTKKILLDIATEHPEIIKDNANYKPWVCFMNFGDSSLDFVLFCTIRNINLKYIVTSELNFAIDKAFRENGIVIAFPQRDIHIKDDGKGICDGTTKTKAGL